MRGQSCAHHGHAEFCWFCSILNTTLLLKQRGPFHLRVTGHFLSVWGDHPINALGAYLTMASCLWGFGQGARFHPISPWLVTVSSLGQRFLEGLPSGATVRFFSTVFRTIWGRAGPLCWGPVGAGGGMGLTWFLCQFWWRRGRCLSHMWLSPYWWGWCDCGAVAHVGDGIEIVFGFLLWYGAAGAGRAFVFWLGFPVSLATSLCLGSFDWGCLADCG